MAAAKKAPDWERIEIEYRAGILSLREIAAANGCSHVAVSKKAKAQGWTKDLKAKIRAKAESLVNAATVTNEVNAKRRVNDEQAVEAGALAIASVRMSHRADITRFRKLALDMLGELEVETGSLELFEELGDMLRSEDKSGQDKRNDIYRKVISSAGRVDSLKKLAETMKHLIALEREAYGIGDSSAQTASMAELLRELVEQLPD